MRLLLILGVLVGPLLATGCAPPEQIQNYRVKKDVEPKPPEPPPVGPEAYRIIGAIFPADAPDEQPAWYFKAGGPTEKLKKSEAAIDQFFASLDFKNGVDKMPTWKLPEGWKEAPKRMFTDAVFKFDGGEITLSSVKGGQASNLKRWAVDQLKMPGEKAVDLKQYLTKIKAGNVDGYKVSLTGPNDPTTKSGPMMMGK